MDDLMMLHRFSLTVGTSTPTVTNLSKISLVWGSRWPFSLAIRNSKDIKPTERQTLS